MSSSPKCGGRSFSRYSYVSNVGGGKDVVPLKSKVDTVKVKVL